MRYSCKDAQIKISLCIFLDKRISLILFYIKKRLLEKCLYQRMDKAIEKPEADGKFQKSAEQKSDK